MCLAIPGLVVELDPAAASAVIDVAGARRDVSVLLLGDDVAIGDWVVVHVGFAIAKVDEAEAERTLALLGEALDAEAEHSGGNEAELRASGRRGGHG